jgi:hypothetical protein
MLNCHLWRSRVERMRGEVRGMAAQEHDECRAGRYAMLHRRVGTLGEKKEFRGEVPAQRIMARPNPRTVRHPNAVSF